MSVDLLDTGRLRAHGQTMPIGGHRAKQAGIHLQQHAVEVIPHVLLGHGKTGAFDQPAQLALREGEIERTLAVLDTGEIIGRQRRQGESAATCLDDQFLLVDTNVDQCIARQTFADIHQLTRRYGDLTRLGRFFQSNPADQFNFKIGAGKRQLLILHHQQDVRQNRQRLSALHDACDQQQRFQQGFALNGEMHGLSLWQQLIRW